MFFITCENGERVGVLGVCWIDNLVCFCIDSFERERDL